ncbi:Fibrinogen-like coiled coil protein [uncultured Mediterranean phage uvMED]|nr:Fibrinogen-like coiled coil protein [uncultured Mediterranean phage uvMED]BAR17865.1 Fibrinogen-like coiled coil protein [uncultured Mediterranean phage uvMED]BAR17957.1 Fibrinogen-like coiled coil protein [uncultured Mediterranean phage uvMED]
MKISDSTAISMPMRNLIALIVAIGIGILGYSDLTTRLTQLETARQLMEADLLKKAEQTPVNQELYMLLEFTSGQVEKIQEQLEDMSHNKVNITRLQTDMNKALESIEDIKDKVRQNGG